MKSNFPYINLDVKSGSNSIYILCHFNLKPRSIFLELLKHAKNGKQTKMEKEWNTILFFFLVTKKHSKYRDGAIPWITQNEYISQLLHYRMLQMIHRQWFNLWCWFALAYTNLSSKHLAIMNLQFWGRFHNG